MSALSVDRYEGTAEEWDGLVHRCEGWTAFHLYAWRRIVGRVHGHDCPYLVARDAGGRLAGVLPLVEVASVPFGRFMVSMPYLNYGGPLGSEPAVRALVGEAVRLAETANAKLLELRCGAAQPVDLPVSHRKITVLLDIPEGGPDALFGSFKAKLRSQVRRPQKEGVTIRFGADQVEPFFEVFARHMRDLGTPTQPRALFEAIAREFGETVWFGCAWLDGRPIACACAFRWGAEIEMTWASALVEYNRVSANMGLYWAFMERAAAEGCRTFNFGRCTPGSATHRFKQQWGGRDAELHWYQWSPRGAGAHTPSPDDGVYSWGPRLWRHLPVGVATALGPRIVRGIP